MVAIHGYNIYRKDRNANGGVAVYIKNHILVKLRDNLMFNTVEVWQGSLEVRVLD